MLSSNRSQELTDGLTSPDSAVSTTSIVDRMLRAYERSLEQQRLGFCIAIGIWALVVLMALIGLFWRAGGEERWDRWRGRPVETGGRYDEKATDEKSGFKMFHLRNHSTVSGRQSPPPKSPVDHHTVHHLANYSFPSSPPLTSPLPPVPTFGPSTKDQPSSASWASLVDFFKPTLPTQDTTPLPPPKKRIDLPSLPAMSLAIPRAIRSKTTFKPRPLISRPRPSSQQRRASDLVDLRTGEYVARSVPPGKARGGVGKRVRGVGDDLMQRVKGRSIGRVEEPRRRRRSYEAGTEWEPINDPNPSHPLDDSPQLSSLPYMPAPFPASAFPSTNPFADPSLLPPRFTSLQPPISPPPPHPYRSSSAFHPYTANPFADSHQARSVTKQTSRYTAGSRPTNPFATPFDGEDE